MLKSPKLSHAPSACGAPPLLGGRVGRARGAAARRGRRVGAARRRLALRELAAVQEAQRALQEHPQILGRSRCTSPRARRRRARTRMPRARGGGRRGVEVGRRQPRAAPRTAARRRDAPPSPRARVAFARPSRVGRVARLSHAVHLRQKSSAPRRHARPLPPPRRNRRAPASLGRAKPARGGARASRAALGGRSLARSIARMSPSRAPASARHCAAGRSRQPAERHCGVLSTARDRRHRRATPKARCARRIPGRNDWRPDQASTAFRRRRGIDDTSSPTNRSRARIVPARITIPIAPGTRKKPSALSSTARARATCYDPPTATRLSAGRCDGVLGRNTSRSRAQLLHGCAGPKT